VQSIKFWDVSYVGCLRQWNVPTLGAALRSLPSPQRCTSACFVVCLTCHSVRGCLAKETLCSYARSLQESSTCLGR
jgi:hypothetical protein